MTVHMDSFFFFPTVTFLVEFFVSFFAVFVLFYKRQKRNASISLQLFTVCRRVTMVLL